MNSVLVQGIGFIALGFTIFSFQQKERSVLLKIQIISSTLYSIHFYLLNALAGASMNALTILRSYIFYQKNLQKWAHHSYWVYLFLFGIAVFSYYTWQDIYSLLPALGLAIGTIAYCQDKTANVRLISLGSRPLWFVYNVVQGSIPGMIVEILILIATIVAILWLDMRKDGKIVE